MAQKPPYVAHDGHSTYLVYAPGKAVRMESAEQFAPGPTDAVLADYPVKRWVELMLQSIEVAGKVVPTSIKKVFQGLLMDPSLAYSLDNFSKEHIMATAKKAAATDAKAKNAAKAAPAEKPAKKTAAADAAPAVKKTKAADAAPAKQATKKGAATEGGEGRKGRPSPHALDAKIAKGKTDFKEHVREGSHRFNRYDFLVKNAGKTVGDVLGKEFEPGYEIVSKHITSAVEEGYITLSK